MSAGLSTSNVVKLAAALVGLAVAAFLALRALGGSHDVGDRAYYYDESEQRLYVAASHQYPPLEGVGGQPDDGVMAIVYACTDDTAEEDRQIAYLQKYTPALVARLEENDRQLRETGAIAEPLDRGFMTDQTLVRRVGEDQWHSQSSPEGQAIIAVLYRECDNGQYPRLCSPDE